jgi:ornithine cyclodeaminase/alanine dehydrogenase-like protein (mu-crystallin family)
MHQDIGRRRFLKTSVSGLVGLPMVAHSMTRVAPSDRIRVAHIGTGFQGGSHIRWFAGFSDVETVALCDVDSVRLGNGLKLLA